MSFRSVSRQWGPGLFLAVLAVACWWLATSTDSDVVSTEALGYERDVETPVLSVRRMPRALQAPIADRALEPAIESVISQLPPSSCVTVQASDRAIGSRHNVDQPLVPASNQKIVTTFAAIESLGADFRFRTTLSSVEAPVDGTIPGDLYFVGGGDPFLTTENWWTQYEEVEGRSHTRLEDLADAVVELGITEVAGSLVGDESLFDSSRIGPWAARLIDGNQSGPLSALTVNEGFVDWPETFPGSFVDRSPTDQPALHAATVLNQLLAERGVTVGAVAAGTAPQDAVVRAAVESPQLSETITHINSFSSNIGAELLLKRLGVQELGTGTSDAGAEAVLISLGNAGVSSEGLVVTDGSGLSESNRVTCRSLSQILTRSAPGSTLANSLSISGNRGSLSSLFVDTAADGVVLAKTGTLNTVIALSGFVIPTGYEGDAISFTYVANSPTALVDPVNLSARNELVLAIAEYPVAPELAELSPASAQPS